MSEISERYRTVAGRFTDLARSVPEGGWDSPAPCEGWVARDIVRHMVSWMPGFVLGNDGLALAKPLSADDDPVRAWEVVSDAIQAALDDRELATRPVGLGRSSVEDAVALYGIGDVLVHTWDLARATGLDEALDANEVHRLVETMESLFEDLRASGQFGARVDVAADADDQTRLLAFTGRRP